MMKVLRLVFATLVIGVASISTAQARDSFSLGVNIGGYPYYAPPPVVYYPAPVYYSEPVYYQSEPRYYSYAPAVSYRYFNDGFRGCRRGWGHEEHEHHGWDHEGREHHGGHHWR